MAKALLGTDHPKPGALTLTQESLTAANPEVRLSYVARLMNAFDVAIRRVKAARSGRQGLEHRPLLVKVSVEQDHTSLRLW
jgi:hypothetical protein